MLRNLKWRYLIAGILAATIVFAGSILMFPDWGNSYGWVLVLIVVVISGVVEFLANWRQVFDNASPRAASTQSHEASSEPSVGQRESDDSINVGNIINSTGVAIGRDAKATITGIEKKDA